MLVAVVASNDLPSLEVLIDGGAFRKEDRASVVKTGALLRELLGAWDYTTTPQFLTLIAGKSPAVVSMHRKLAADPVHRAGHRDAFLAALRALMESDDAFALAPLAEHGRLRRIRHDVALWANPDS